MLVHNSPTLISKCLFHELQHCISSSTHNLLVTYTHYFEHFSTRSPKLSIYSVQDKHKAFLLPVANDGVIQMKFVIETREMYGSSYHLSLTPSLLNLFIKNGKILKATIKINSFAYYNCLHIIHLRFLILSFHLSNA